MDHPTEMGGMLIHVNRSGFRFPEARRRSLDREGRMTSSEWVAGLIFEMAPAP